MIKRLVRAITAGLLLFAFITESPAPARGQGVGIYRGRQGRRVGRITLPTPPFNPDAGILDGQRGRGRNSPRVAPRRSVNRNKHADNQNPRPGTPRRRRVRRGWHRR